MGLKIRSFQDFVDGLLKAGFSLGGGNSDGIFSLVSWGWEEQPPYETPVRWHTGEKETDPWEWRMRVLDERDDISYAKVFFSKSGYITREWAPDFLAARRENKSFEEEHSNGTISHCAKLVFDVISRYDALPFPDLKMLSGLKDEKAKFERALVELQMKMFITICGRRQKTSFAGEEYGWASTVFCTTEKFWDKEVFAKAAGITKSEAAEKILQRVLELNPDAERKRILKFISG